MKRWESHSSQIKMILLPKWIGTSLLLCFVWTFLPFADSAFGGENALDGYTIIGQGRQYEAGDNREFLRSQGAKTPLPMDHPEFYQRRWDLQGNTNAMNSLCSKGKPIIAYSGSDFSKLRLTTQSRSLEAFARFSGLSPAEAKASAEVLNVYFQEYGAALDHGYRPLPEAQWPKEIRDMKKMMGPDADDLELLVKAELPCDNPLDGLTKSVVRTPQRPKQRFVFSRFTSSGTSLAPALNTAGLSASVFGSALRHDLGISDEEYRSSKRLFAEEKLGAPGKLYAEIDREIESFQDGIAKMQEKNTEPLWEQRLWWWLRDGFFRSCSKQEADKRRAVNAAIYGR